MQPPEPAQEAQEPVPYNLRVIYSLNPLQYWNSLENSFRLPRM